MCLLSVPCLSSCVPEPAPCATPLCSHYHGAPHPFLRCRSPTQKFTSKCLSVVPISLTHWYSPEIQWALTLFSPMLLLSQSNQ